MLCLTAPLARVAAQFRNDLPTPYRRYAMGPVWRNEKPGPGRFRQFYQCDADTVGSASVGCGVGVVSTGSARSVPRGRIVEHPASNAARPTVTIVRRFKLQRFMLAASLIDVH